MRKIIFCPLLLLPCIMFAQVGIKAGLNFAKVSNASDINSSNRSGFHAGVFLSPSLNKLFSSRTELLFSHQGFDYKKGTNTGQVDLDYIQVGQLLSINATKYLSLMFGAQTAYLVSAAVDSSNGGSSGGGSGSAIMELYNRVDYGYAIGVEGHPIAGLIIGVRYNVSLAKVYKDIQSGQRPAFSSADAKNNVIQLSVGWRFGRKVPKKAKG